MNNLQQFRDNVFAKSDAHCFIERERLFSRLGPGIDPERPDAFARLFSALLDGVSVPVEPFDMFVGRVVEALPDEGMQAPRYDLRSTGHQTPDYSRLLTLGYRGILENICKNADRIGMPRARDYARNAEIVIEAVRRFALRYADAAERAGNARAAEALRRVPYEPAYDLFSALQGIWLVHMIAGCYVGARDYAFGYMDEYLYPFYLIEREKGASDDDIADMLAHFYIKANEICGLCTHNHRVKPIPSRASKQYVLLDGGRANALSPVILKAARLSRMAQPQFTVVLTKDSPEAFKAAAFEAMADLTDKLHVYNGDLLIGFLRKKGLPEDIAQRPAFSACCTFDLNFHSFREEYYLPTVQIFCKTLLENSFSDKASFLRAFSEAVTADCQHWLEFSRLTDDADIRRIFVLDTLLLGECDEQCDYPPYALKWRAKNIFLPGIATLGDSLMALDRLVFEGHELGYDEFAALLKNDFKGREDLLGRLGAVTRFGNDTPADDYAVQMADLLIDAVERAETLPGEVIVPGFYSLERDNTWAASIPATPDGRRCGQPFSENQSPTYGADKKGVTALLNSLSKLPFDRTAAGGLNLTFTGGLTGPILRSLIETYFAKGGLHAGVSLIKREELEDAMVNPARYRSLTVRLYGFSEYFTALPDWQQLAVLNRTAY